MADKGATGPASEQPADATAALALSDGTTYWGHGFGAPRTTVGEVCFNTSMTGYQEILTDPSYAGQIITFTFPHIGNVGVNPDDIEATTPYALGLVLRTPVTDPSNHRARRHFNDWLVSMNLPGICNVDTRRLARRIRGLGAPHGALAHFPDGRVDLASLHAMAAEWPGLENADLAGQVSCRQSYDWTRGSWTFDDGVAGGYRVAPTPHLHVVAMDFGVKHNILRNLAQLGCSVTVVPATTDAETILARRPDGIFLSNGPGDPAATGRYAVPVIAQLLESGLPIFGICLGHQLLSLALGAKTEKMHIGHRGANHPVKDLMTAGVEITSQNHGFVVSEESLPDNVTVTHRSLFDGSVEGISLANRPVFSVQYHPEASPGPKDSHHLFSRFVAHMEGQEPAASRPSRR